MAAADDGGPDRPVKRPPSPPGRDPADEPVVEPDLPIVDPHHHLWSYPERGGYQPVYLLDDLHADTGSGHRVVATVFVECGWAYRTDGPPEMREVGETADVAGSAVESTAGDGATDDGATGNGSATDGAAGDGARIAGIVGSCDLRLDPATLDRVLDAHEQAGRGLFRGIRHRVAHDPTGSARTSRADDNPPGLLLDERFRAGVALLGRRGLTFDAWLYHVQLPELVDLARAVPGTTIVLDHLGAPLGVGAYAGRRAEVLAAWRADLTALAASPNVVVKLGGVGMRPYGSGWADRGLGASSDEIVHEWGEPIRFVIETFGPHRCMFESNFPVDKVSFSYRTMWNAYKRMTSDFTASERADLFAGTAVRTYRLGL
jgi:predicted TIM-barrel fold metal-dependent hydrolase